MKFALDNHLLSHLIKKDGPPKTCKWCLDIIIYAEGNKFENMRSLIADFLDQGEEALEKMCKNKKLNGKERTHILNAMKIISKNMPELKNKSNIWK